jgi:hypothetical protein
MSERPQPAHEPARPTLAGSEQILDVRAVRRTVDLNGARTA